VKPFIALILACTAFAAQSGPFAGGNVEAGKKLFDQNHCNRCHMSIMGGDGNTIFTRPNHKVDSPEHLLDQLYACSGNAGVMLSKQDEQDLSAYLNRNYYHFK
jgi:cytochrome c553